MVAPPANGLEVVRLEPPSAEPQHVHYHTQKVCCLTPNARGNVETHNCGECNAQCYLAMIILFGVFGGIFIIAGLVIWFPVTIFLTFIGIGMAVASCVLCCCCHEPLQTEGPVHIPLSQHVASGHNTTLPQHVQPTQRAPLTHDVL